MKIIFHILIDFLMLICLVIGHIALSLFCPYPLSKISIYFAGLILWLLWNPRGRIVWYTFFACFVIELYSVMPFGLNLFSGTAAMLFAFWLYRHIFTNRSWYACFVLSIVVLGIYRSLYSIGLLFLNLFGKYVEISWQSLFFTSFWEMMLTTLMVGFLYFIISLFSNKLNPRVIEARYFRI